MWGIQSSGGACPARIRRATSTGSIRTMERLVAHHRDAIARADLREVVPHRDMLHTPIVPERHRVRLPAEADLPVRAAAMLVEEVEDRAALCLRHVLDRMGDHRTDADRLPPGDRMGADHWMLGARERLRPLGTNQA